MVSQETCCHPDAVPYITLPPQHRVWPGILPMRRIQTHLLAFEVYMRKRKLLLALAAVKGAHAAAPAPGDPDAHLVTVRFAQAVRESTASSDDQASHCVHGLSAWCKLVEQLDGRIEDCCLWSSTDISIAVARVALRQPWR